MTPATWRGDPALIVYAARHALTRPASACHAALLVSQAVRANAAQLPHGARTTLVRDIGAWLDGPGSVAAPPDREPWVLALAALGVRRRYPQEQAPPVQPLRRRTDTTRRSA